MLRSPKPLAGCAICSGWIAARAEYPRALADAARSTPILQCHGRDDARIPVAWAQRSHGILVEQLGLAAGFHVYDGLGHSTCTSEMVRVGKYFAAALARRGKKRG